MKTQAEQKGLIHTLFTPVSYSQPIHSLDSIEIANNSAPNCHTEAMQ